MKFRNMDEITKELRESIKELPNDELLKVIMERKPLGLFYEYDEKVERYVGVDNSNGDAWTEQFKYLEACKDWLTGEGCVETIQEREKNGYYN
ncbi:MAG: hypothetical protein ACOC2W_00605 [bacterium]